jgi:hypothetical protein
VAISPIASALDADSIFEESAKLGFSVQDERLKAFLKVSKNSKGKLSSRGTYLKGVTS